MTGSEQDYPAFPEKLNREFPEFRIFFRTLGRLLRLMDNAGRERSAGMTISRKKAGFFLI